jgi:uncharacterized protein YidB (DUF937 family)
MGLLDNVLGMLGGKGGDSSQLLGLVTGLVTSSGGLDGLLQKFSGAGLGNVVQSWISKGENLPISGDQILKVFGQGTIGDLAQKAGLDTGTAASGIAHVLPTIVDKLTPDGAAVGGDALESGIKNLLSGGLGKLLS